MRSLMLSSPPPHAGEGPGERGSTAPYDALILAVAHRDFIDMGAAGLRALGKPKSVLYDVTESRQNPHPPRGLTGAPH